MSDLSGKASKSSRQPGATARAKAPSSPRGSSRDSAPDAPFAFIIVAMDGSPFAERALPIACGLARRAGDAGRIELVHVHDRGNFSPNAPMVDPTWENDRAAEMNLDLGSVAEVVARDTKLPVTAVMLRGDAAESLTRYAAERGADLLVMTTHGRSGIRRAVLGSVTERVLRAAAIPVLVVPSSAHAARAGQ